MKNSYLQSLGTLQLLAVTAIVIGHYWIKDNPYPNSVCASFCFVYSGFFTAKRHIFGPAYGLKDHVRFMRDKLVRLYPIHVLALALCIITMLATGMMSSISLKVLLAHLTLFSPWIPDYNYYFGFNPVAWFVCDLFFLYLMAPLVVRLLRKMSVLWQVLVIIGLLVLEYYAGYTVDVKENLGTGLVSAYFLYEFPPVRLLDFGAGIAIYNLTQTGCWSRLQSRMNASMSTLVELAGIALFVVLFILGRHIHEHCYRAFCASAPAITALLTAFVLTSSNNGLISRLFTTKVPTRLSTVSTEVYLLQFCVYFALQPLCRATGIADNIWLHLPVIMIALFVTSWAVHKWYCQPVRQWLTQRLEEKCP